MKPRPSQHEYAAIRRGLTLAEVLVAVSLVFVLGGILVVGGRAMANSQKRSTARQQIALLAQAVERYAAFWPQWKVGNVVVAEEGWPDFVAGRLFAPDPYGPFEELDPFNDHVTFNVQGGIFRQLPRVENPDYVGIGDVLGANICLAYALTAGSGKGPYLPGDDIAVLKDVADPVLIDGYHKAGNTLTNPLLPPYVDTAAAKRAQVLVDPWGTPYRYFWVYRDADAYRGYLPVDYGAYRIDSDDDGGIGSALFLTPDGRYKVAVGFVLESAGPNRKFGNLWKLDPNDPNDPDFTEASDNLLVTP